MIIGITGFKRAGKDTLAKHFIDKYGYKPVSFATPFKKASLVMFGWGPEHLEDKKEEVDPYFHISPRHVWQTLGTEWGQLALQKISPEFKKEVGRTIWARAAAREMMNDGCYVITDFRFHHEVKYFREMFEDKFVLIRVNRQSVRPKWWKILFGFIFLHYSERHVEYLDADIDIDNDSTIEDLYERIERFKPTLPNPCA